MQDGATLNAPMIRGDGASVFHGSPLRPVGNLVANLPDLLTPDNILKIQRRSIVHHPLGNSATGLGPNLERC